MHWSCRGTNLFILLIFYWITTLRYIFCGWWTCAQGELYLPLAVHPNFVSILLYHMPPLIVESQRIWFRASTSLRLTITRNGKGVLSNNFHAMGGIFKERWHWYLIINFPLDGFRDWPRTTIDVCFSIALILL